MAKESDLKLIKYLATKKEAAHITCNLATLLDYPNAYKLREGIRRLEKKYNFGTHIRTRREPGTSNKYIHTLIWS